MKLKEVTGNGRYLTTVREFARVFVESVRFYPQEKAQDSILSQLNRRGWTKRVC